MGMGYSENLQFIVMMIPRTNTGRFAMAESRSPSRSHAGLRSRPLPRAIKASLQTEENCPDARLVQEWYGQGGRLGALAASLLGLAGRDGAYWEWEWEVGFQWRTWVRNLPP